MKIHVIKGVIQLITTMTKKNSRWPPCGKNTKTYNEMGSYGYSIATSRAQQQIHLIMKKIPDVCLETVDFFYRISIMMKRYYVLFCWPVDHHTNKQTSTTIVLWKKIDDIRFNDDWNWCMTPFFFVFGVATFSFLFIHIHIHYIPFIFISFI